MPPLEDMENMLAKVKFMRDSKQDKVKEEFVAQPPDQLKVKQAEKEVTADSKVKNILLTVTSTIAIRYSYLCIQFLACYQWYCFASKVSYVVVMFEC